MQRTEAPLAGDERAMLTGFLDRQRATVRIKCTGLDDAGAAVAPIATSPLMTIGGIVNHLRWVEYDWLEHDLLGRPDLAPWTDEEPDKEFTVGATTPIATVLEEYEAQCARCREIVAGHALDVTSVQTDRHTGEPFTLRWIVNHLIEETARHLGHIDLIREYVDGTTGE